MPDDTSFSDRLFVAGLKGPLEPLACRALKKAVHLLGLVLADRIRELRDADDRILNAAGKIEEQAALLSLGREVAEILGARWDKLPDQRRPHYTPTQRFRILRIKHLLALSPEETARLFRVSAGTVYRWQAEMSGTPEQPTIGATVRPTPPLRRYADVVHHTLQAMAVLGFQGCEHIAAMLARVGWRLSASTVRRMLKAPVAAPPPAPAPTQPTPRAVRAKYVNHVWMMDLTVVRGVFGLFSFEIAAIIDVFSRFPVAVRAFRQAPSADELLLIVEAALRSHGRPRHFVSDQGPQFRDDGFRERLKIHRVEQRYGAVGKTGSVSIIDRFFRTLKEGLLAHSWRPLLLRDLERRLAPVLLHYALFRPHQALGGATPAEVYFGLEPACRNARHPPRGQPGVGPTAIPFEVVYLDPRNRRLPVLRKAA